MKKTYLFAALAFAAFSLTSATAFASLSNDEVTSQKLKEADGTSAQNTNSGSGVKTGHIQDGAVTSGKILDGAVATADLANNAVTGDKIADGAITDAKITGTISAAKIDSTGLNADTVDGKHAADLAAAVHTHTLTDTTGLTTAIAGKADASHGHTTADVANLTNLLNVKADQTSVDAALAAKADTTHAHFTAKVAIVAVSGGEYSNPLDAFADMGNWCGTPSATNPCMIKVMPGVYNVGDGSTGRIHVGAYLTLEGSGQDVTKITGSDIASHIYGGVLSIGSNSLVKDITIENTAITAGTFTVAIMKGYEYDGKLVNVKAISNGNGLASQSYAIRMLGGKTDFTNVSAIATGATNSNTGIAYTLLTGENYLKGANVLAYGDGVSNIGVSAWSYYDYPQYANERGIKISGSNLKAEGVGGNNNGYTASSSAPSITQKNIVHDSILTGSTNAISSGSATMAFRISDSQLAGPVGISAAAATSCSNAYDANFSDVVCP